MPQGHTAILDEHKAAYNPKLVLPRRGTILLAMRKSAELLVPAQSEAKAQHSQANHCGEELQASGL
jgi:hypothetical protein